MLRRPGDAGHQQVAQQVGARSERAVPSPGWAGRALRQFGSGGGQEPVAAFGGVWIAHSVRKTRLADGMGRTPDPADGAFTSLSGSWPDWMGDKLAALGGSLDMDDPTAVPDPVVIPVANGTKEDASATKPQARKMRRLYAADWAPCART